MKEKKVYSGKKKNLNEMEASKFQAESSKSCL